MRTMMVKKGDMVTVVAGREKGKTGKVLSVDRKKNRVYIEKLNLLKKHKRPDAEGKGGILEKEGSIAVSNVALFCTKCNSGTRVGYQVLEDGKKVRICRKCQEILGE